MNTRKLIHSLFVCGTLSLTLFLPLTIHAENDYTVLAPLPGTTTCDDKNLGSNCQTDLKRYVEGLFKLMIGLSAVFAVLVIVFGGFQYMSSDAISGKSAGKEKVYNAVWGLVLVIAAWLILNTINPNLTKNLNLNIESAEIKLPFGGGTLGVNSTGTLSTSGKPMTQSEIDASDAVKTALKNAGVDTYAGPCTNGQATYCVNLNGLDTNLQSDLVGLKQSCGSGCVVQITGASEPQGHSGGSTHYTGDAVDLNISNQALNNFIMAKPPTGQNSLGPIYTVTIGGKEVTFLKESNPPHWHVQQK